MSAHACPTFPLGQLVGTPNALEHITHDVPSLVCRRDSRNSCRARTASPMRHHSDSWASLGGMPALRTTCSQSFDLTSGKRGPQVASRESPSAC